jgi:hypothetical protein
MVPFVYRCPVTGSNVQGMFADELPAEESNPKKDGKLWLVFPNGDGNIEWHTNIVLRGLQPTLMQAGVTIRAKDDEGRPVVDQDGKPVFEAK